MQTLSKLTIEQKNELKKGVIEVTGKAMNRSALGVVDAIFTLYPNITFSELKEILNLARTPHGTVDNVMRIHSLRPNTMKGHVTLYRAALHDESNKIPM